MPVRVVRAVVVREQYRIIRRPSLPPPKPPKKGGGGWLAAACVIGGLVVVGKLAGGDASPVVKQTGRQSSAIVNGHCHTKAWASASASGGGEISAVLDSGAGAGLWLSRGDAARIGFNVGSLDFSHRYRGVSGPGWSAYVTVAQFRIGGLRLTDVPAWVSSETDGVNESLIGLPILQQVNYRVENGSCVLSW